MADFAWIAAQRELSNAALTVQAQAVSLNDQGRLLWDVFFPRQNANSVKVRNIVGSIDFRPTSERREWNARGKNIPLRVPNVADVELIPVESTFRLGEKEIQDIYERVLGNEALFRQIVGADIPPRIDSLALANLRRIEVDAFSAWATRTVTVRNPVTGTTEEVAFPFADERYESSTTPWDDAGVNAYDEFLAWLQRAIDLVGPIQGVMLRLTDLNIIKGDAPNPFKNNADEIALTRNQLEERLQDELGSEFSFFVNENTVDISTDGGDAFTRTKVWPTSVIAAVPAGDTVGATYFAPVARAYDISRAAPEARLDVRGQTVYLETGNGGRELVVECQVNPITIPDETRVATIKIDESAS